jgi:dimethylargininase
LYVGISGRTDAAGVEELRSVAGRYGYSVTAVELRDCLHLKSACCFVGNGVVLINRAWVDGTVFAGYRLIDVAPEEPWGANALRVGGAVVMASVFPLTAERLRTAGFEVRTVDVSELMKAESGVTCSSLIVEE